MLQSASADTPPAPSHSRHTALLPRSAPRWRASTACAVLFCEGGWAGAAEGSPAPGQVGCRAASPTQERYWYSTIRARVGVTAERHQRARVPPLCWLGRDRGADRERSRSKMWDRDRAYQRREQRLAPVVVRVGQAATIKMSDEE